MLGERSDFLKKKQFLSSKYTLLYYICSENDKNKCSIEVMAYLLSERTSEAITT